MVKNLRLIDTSIFIDYLRGNQKAKDWLDSFTEGELVFSVITAAESLAGCRNRQEQDAVEQELACYPTLHLSNAISATALDWYRRYRLSHGVGFLDCLIGASAYQYEMTICTLNDKHFHPFPKIKIERPY
jgi:predicted nucleic acid-binding protein